jgi:hypothetical protein
VNTVKSSCYCKIDITWCCLTWRHVLIANNKSLSAAIRLGPPKEDLLERQQLYTRETSQSYRISMIGAPFVVPNGDIEAGGTDVPLSVLS